MNGLEKIAFTKDEQKKYEQYFDKIMSNTEKNVGTNDLEKFEALKNQAHMGISRDIQAQRLPPNVKVPSRKKIFAYINTMYQNLKSSNPGESDLSNLITATSCLFAPGSWTSSGGSHVLADMFNYNFSKILENKENPSLLEIGAGYAGFKSKTPAGINKVYRALVAKGITPQIDFTNLTNWHEKLPENVTEHPGYVARDLKCLSKDVIRSYDIIYSQAAAYFETEVADFLEGANALLKPKGKLIYNGHADNNAVALNVAKDLGLELQLTKDLDHGKEGGNNGFMYVFSKD